MAEWKNMGGGRQIHAAHVMGNIWYVVYKADHLWIGHLFNKAGNQGFSPADDAADSDVSTSLEAAMKKLPDAIIRVRDHMNGLIADAQWNENHTVADYRNTSVKKEN